MNKPRPEKPKEQTDTYDGWQKRGRHVVKGAHNCGRNELGVCVFKKSDTAPNRTYGLYYCNEEDDSYNNDVMNDILENDMLWGSD